MALHNRWLGLLTFGLSLKFVPFGRLLDLNFRDFIPRVVILIVPEGQITVNFDQSLHSSSSFYITLGLNFSKKSSSRNLYFFRCIELIKLSYPILHWHHVTPKTQSNRICCLVWTHVDFQTRFCPIKVNWSWVFLKVSMRSFFYFCWNVRLLVINCKQCSGFLMDQKHQIVMIDLTCLDTQTHNSSALSSSFFIQSIILQPFFEAHCSFWNLLELVLYIGIGVLNDQK